LQYMDSQMEIKYEEIREKHKSSITKLYPFSSERKMMSTLLKSDSGEYSHILYSKGAAEIVLERCTQVMQEDGTEAPLDEKLTSTFEQLIKDYASTGLRTIALTCRKINNELNWEDEDAVVAELTFIALAGIKDPVRKEVPDAVRKCQEAGIIVRMITGDNILTATHIARECGILTEDGVAIEGSKFRKMSQAEMDEIIPKLQVIARSSPTDKYMLVHRLRELGEVVAVTGDGVNDAPQLKEADVGFAMGITGTEVAKDASDIVLLDDNFSSIEKAVLWGRNVYDSIRKFVQFQLTVNLVAVAIAFIGAVTNGESPLSPIQLLWVNLIMDTFAALALATEAPTEELLQRRPYGRYDSLITRNMWRNIIGQSLYQLGVLLVMLYAIHIIPIFGLPHSQSQFSRKDRVIQNTLIFNAFVMCQLFNEINSRKLGNELNVFKGLFKNPIFLGIMVFSVAVQFLLTHFGGSFAQTHPLTVIQWLCCVVIGFISLPYGILLRGIFRFKEAERVHPSPVAEKGKGKEKETRIEIVPAEGALPPKKKEEEKPLLPPRPVSLNWRRAQDVMTEVNVLTTLRHYKRPKTNYPTKKHSERRTSVASETLRRNSFLSKRRASDINFFPPK